MSKGRSRNLLIYAGMFSLIAATFFYLKADARRGGIEIASALSATTGDLAALYLANPREAIEPNARLVMKDLIRQQAMILLILHLDVEEFDAAGFAGICRLVAYRNELFNAPVDGSGMSISYKIINTNLARLAQAVERESATRSSGTTGPQSCPGFRSDKG